MLDKSANPFIPHTETFTTDPAMTTGLRRINLQYPLSVSSSDLERVYAGTGGSGGTTELTTWRNETGMLRGTPASYYKDDALVRAIPRGDLTNQTGSAFELQNSARTTTVWGRRWLDGGLVRNGVVMNDVLVLSAAASVPAGTPTGTVIIRTST